MWEAKAVVDDSVGCHDHAFPVCVSNLFTKPLNGEEDGYSSNLVQIASTDSEAIQKLEFWSTTIKDDFKRGNVSGVQGGPLQRCSIADQISKMIDSVSKMLQAKVDMRAQLVMHHRMLDRLGAEISYLRTTTQQLLANQEIVMEN
jgi:hypothetical protein